MSYLKLTTISVLLCLSLSPIGGYGGHEVKFSAVLFCYYFFTIYSLNAIRTSLRIFIVLLLLALPPLLIYIPIHVSDFNETKFSFPSTLAHFIGIGFGLFAHYVAFRLKILITALIITGSIWVRYTGYDLWLNKVNYGTYTGMVNYALPAPIKGHDRNGHHFSEKNYKNKIILLDFWHTRCGVCFKKFPVLQNIYNNYKTDTSVLVLAMNKPLKEDTAGYAFAVLEKIGYNFPVLLPDSDTLPEMFNVQSYPTTFIINRSEKVVFRGDIENAQKVLDEMTREKKFDKASSRN